MSLFDDDFYSTKVSSWRYGNRSFPSRERRWATPLILLAALAIVSLVVLFLFDGEDGVEVEQVSVGLTPGELETLKLDYNQLVIRAAERVNPTIVSVIGTETTKGDARPGSMGLGSGVIFQKEGKYARIVTNHHVIQHVNEIQVVLPNGEHRKASLVGEDAFTDVAVLEIDAEGIEHVAEFGDSDLLRAGEAAIAIGNPLGLDFAQTITVGVISSPHRTIPVSLGQDSNIDWELDVIQTDAAINQGNSGGALVNLEGKVIGINSMKIADFGVEGLGFAIPINEIKPIIESLIVDGKVKRPYLGVYTQDLNAYIDEDNVLELPEHVNNGIIVLDATGPAAKAGLKTNDVIVELDGHEIGSTIALRKYLYANKQIGDDVEVTYYREGKKREVTVTLGELGEE